MRFGRFYFDYFPRWDNLGLLRFHSILIGVALSQNWQWLPNQNKNGDNTASKWTIHRKQNKVHAFVHFFGLQNKTQGFISFKCHSERNFVYISIFKNGPKYAPTMVRFIFNFLWASSHVFGCETLKIQSHLSMKAC